MTLDALIHLVQVGAGEESRYIQILLYVSLGFLESLVRSHPYRPAQDLVNSHVVPVRFEDVHLSHALERDPFRTRARDNHDLDVFAKLVLFVVIMIAIDASFLGAFGARDKGIA